MQGEKASAAQATRDKLAQLADLLSRASFLARELSQSEVTLPLETRLEQDSRNRQELAAMIDDLQSKFFGVPESEIDSIVNEAVADVLGEMKANDRLQQRKSA
jgi:hypothetical protein